jgi:nucleoid DNA-binding protein
MGFGKFSASLVKGREGKNPQDPNGAPLVIPDTMRIYFSAGRKLKEQVNAPLREKQKKSSKKSK